MTTTAFNLSTKTTANGRIAGMSNRSPINRTIDAALHINNAEEIAALKVAISNRLVEAEATKVAALRRFNLVCSKKDVGPRFAKNAATALRNAEITVAALTAAAKRLA